MRKCGTATCFKGEATHELFLKHRSKRPLHLSGALSQGLQDLWSPESLLKFLSAETPVTVLLPKDGIHFLEDPEVVDRETIPFGTFIHKVFQQQDPNRCYLRPIMFEELAPNIVYPTKMVFGDNPGQYSKFWSKSLSMIWIGTKGNITPLHYDRCHGILCQLHGSKRVTFFRPKDTRSLYQRTAESGFSHTSRLCVEKLMNPDTVEEELRKFPNAARAKPYTCMLKQGDCVYIPPGYWHTVEHLENSVSITLAWDMDKMDPIPPNMWA